MLRTSIPIAIAGAIAGILVAASSLAACIKSPPPREPPALGPSWDKGCELSAGEAREGTRSLARDRADLWVIERAGELCDKASRGQGRCQLMDALDNPYPRIHESVLWTGQELLVWGGCVMTDGRLRKTDTGAAFDPAGNVWKPITWQVYAEKRSAMAAIPRERQERPIDLLTRDWIENATLYAHMLETKGLTLIFGGWVSKRTWQQCPGSCPEGEECARKTCFEDRFELIPDGIVITWMGQLRGGVWVGGRPIAGATVRVLTGVSRLVAETRSQDNGGYELDIASGEYILEVSKLGFQTATFPILINRSEVTLVNVDLEPTR